MFPSFLLIKVKVHINNDYIAHINDDNGLLREISYKCNKCFIDGKHDYA